MLAVKSNSAAESQRVSQPWREPSLRPAYRHNRTLLLDKVSMVGCIVLIAAVFWMLAGNSAKVDVMNHSVANLQSTVAQVSAQNAALSTKVDELKRPSRILSIATNQLHMKYANPVQINTSSTSSN